MTNEEAINSLMMCQDLILFDPMTGKTHELWEENKNNQDLYNACDAAIMALFEQAEREKGCEYCLRPEDYPIVNLEINNDDVTIDDIKLEYAEPLKFCPMCGRKLKEV